MFSVQLFLDSILNYWPSLALGSVMAVVALTRSLRNVGVFALVPVLHVSSFSLLNSMTSFTLILNFSDLPFFLFMSAAVVTQC